ncbi:MAG: sigma-54 dependent transcriptional regulator [Rhodothermales bacterium]
MREPHPIAAKEEPGSGPRPRILVVDDEQAFREAICRTLRTEGYDAVAAVEGQQALDTLGAQPVDLVLLDLKLDHSALSGMGVLRAVVEDHPQTPVVMISGRGTIRAAVEATHLGAHDFLEKDVGRERILLTVRNTLEKARLERQRDRLLDEANWPYRLAGSSTAMETVRRAIARAAHTDLPVLITGERGVGKELVAQNIHRQSARAEGRFLAVNVAALSEGLVESELFGHEKGAFNDAVQRIGKFEAAEGGTLFLDEIADMTLATQAKVLRALQEHEVTRVGGNGVIRVDTRVIAATNKDLPAEIEAGAFRADLYDRLDVLRLYVPSLRERSEDVSELVEHVVAQHWTEKGRPFKRFSVEALAAMAGYDWPGNVRELVNGVHRLMANVEGDTIHPRHVAAHVSHRWRGRSGTSVPRVEAPVTAPPLLLIRPLDEAAKGFERRYLVQALIVNGWKKVKTAAALGIDRATLYRKMQEHEIEVPEKHGGLSGDGAGA